MQGTENLDRFLQMWGLSDASPLTQTATSYLYTARLQNNQVVLKIYTSAGVEDEKGAAAALEAFDGQGAVRIFRRDKDAVLLEFAEGPDLKALVDSGRDREATEILADVLNKLHSAQANEVSELIPLEKRFGSLFQKAERDRQSGLPSVYIRAAAVAGDLLKTQQEPHVLHGDMHHENVRFHPQRGWLAIDPKGLWGERTYDAANILHNPDRPDIVLRPGRLEATAQILADRMKVDYDRLLQFAFAYSALSASWSIEDGHAPEPALKIADIIESLMKIKQ